MARKALFRMALCALCATITIVYWRQILPHIAAYPLNTDFAQDYAGARALVNRALELYPVLASTLTQIGIKWPEAMHRSTHPPTAFLLALPFAALGYPLAQMLWMVAMFSCIVVSARMFGLEWRKSLLAGALSLAWPPTIWSLGQLTPIWLLGLVLAYHFRHHPLASGAFIAVASLPKFMAAPALLYHFRRRFTLALVGFGAVWLGGLALLLLLRPDAVTSYLSSNAGSSLEQIRRADNGALVVVAWRLGSWTGLAAGKWIGLAAFASLVLWILRSGLRRNDAAGWSCLVWLGIALLPIAWVYSLLPLLPWLVLALRIPDVGTRHLASAALVIAYAAGMPGVRPWSIALCIVLSGVTFATAPLQKYSYSPVKPIPAHVPPPPWDN